MTVALSTAPASSRQRRFYIALSVGLATVSTALLAFVAEPWPAVPEFVSLYGAGVIFSDLITAFLLFGQFRQNRSVSLLILGAAYLFTGTIVAPHLAAFPDFTEGDGGLIGGPDTAPWLWHFWHIGFPMIVLGKVALMAVRPDAMVPDGRQTQAIAAAVGFTLSVVALLTLLATEWRDALPALTEGRAWNRLTFQLGWVMGALTVAAYVGLWAVTGCRSFLHLWLSVALVAFFFDFTPNLLALQRYSFGWYLGRFNGLIAASFLLMMFLWETNRLYQRLGEMNRRLERRVAERTAALVAANRDLRRTVRDRDLLLGEVHHRVRNNLQILDSLLNVHAMRGARGDPGEALQDFRRYVSALGSVHKQMMRSPDHATPGSCPGPSRPACSWRPCDRSWPRCCGGGAPSCRWRRTPWP